MHTRLWHRLLTPIAVLALPAALLVAVASPARAHSCPGGQSVTVDTPVASAEVTFYPRCGDNQAHWHGVIRDTKCDARSGKVILWAIPEYWSHAYQANNGCGTSSSFSGSDRALNSPWQLQVAVGACNSWSCSGYFAKYLTG